MAELKTRKTGASVDEFIAGIAEEGRREDCRAVVELMRGVTGEEPAMWGPSMVGFGRYRYEYASGRTGEWFEVGFSPRKQSLTLYIMSGFSGYDDLMARLGKHSTGKSCLYIKRLEDVDAAVLEELIRRSVAHIRESGA